MTKTILICDDDEGIVEMLEILLTTFGFTTVTEKSSIHVIERVKNAAPDLILLDLWMPIISGDLILKKLKNDGGTKNIPVIVISASTDGAAIARSAGADYFLPKPFDLKSLLGKIRDLVPN